MNFVSTASKFCGNVLRKLFCVAPGREDFCNQTHFSILHIAHDKKQLFPVVLENEITWHIFFYNCTFCVFYEKLDYLMFQKNLIF